VVTSKYKTITEREKERERESGCLTEELDWLTLVYFAKASRIYTGARVNNSRSNVYHGDFRKPVKACEITHFSALMRTLRADSHFADSDKTKDVKWHKF
jgi:hypothetical protein